MRIPSSVDPLQLSHLAVEIDKQCYKLVTDDFNTTVDAQAFDVFKIRIRDEIVGLFTEILNDMQELRLHVPRPDVLPMNREMPHMASEFVGKIHDVFALPQQGSDAGAIIAWHAKRLMWTADLWLLLQIEFFQMLSRFSPTEKNVTLTDPNGKQTVVTALPLSDLTSLYYAWHTLFRTTMEYLVVKSDLLRATGKDIPLLNISTRKQGQWFDEAMLSFHRGETYSYILLEQAMREVLFKIAQLPDPNMELRLRDLPTSYLLMIVHQAGVLLPFDVETVTNLVRNFEANRSLCSVPPISFSYPAFKIVEAVVWHLNQSTVDTATATQIKKTLMEELRGDSNET